MIYWIVKDMFAGFRGQTRRSMIGIVLLWIGLSVAAAALIISFGLAFSTVKQTQYRIPGDLSRMYFFELKYAGSSQGPTRQALETRADFSPEVMGKLVALDEVTGCFFTIPGYPIGIGGSQQDPILATMLVFAGEVPLYGGTILGELQRVSEAGGIAINNALAAISQAPQLGDRVFLQQNHDVPIVEVVGLAEQLEPLPHVYAPLDLVPASYGTTRLGLYTVKGTDPQALSEKIKDSFFSSDNILVTYQSGSVTYARQQQETRVVAQIAIACGSIIAAVAFVNLGSLVSFWVLNRKRSLRIRRSLGAPKRLIHLYVLFDLLVISGASLLTGFIAVGILEHTLLLNVKIPLVFLGSILWGTCVMGFGTFMVGLAVIKAIGMD